MDENNVEIEIKYCVVMLFIYDIMELIGIVTTLLAMAGLSAF